MSGIMFKEEAWLTKPLLRSATWDAALPTNSESHATPGTEQRLGSQAGKAHADLRDRTRDLRNGKPARYR